MSDDAIRAGARAAYEAARAARQHDTPFDELSEIHQQKVAKQFHAGLIAAGVPSLIAELQRLRDVVSDEDVESIDATLAAVGVES